MIKLYHGTNTTFDKVELDKCLPYKDFGRGFYLTTLRTQALARAKNKCNFEGGAPTILAYQFDEKELANLNVKPILPNTNPNGDGAMTWERFSKLSKIII